ncbi:MAG: hypothetical protein RBT51_04635 [Ectothiorhodospiraceae bacterium]|jgi:Ni/Co efflux regulator RcnB|nr:hypothetical protein [Ectothiorhodospiraceae bacterium]
MNHTSLNQRRPHLLLGLGLAALLAGPVLLPDTAAADERDRRHEPDRRHESDRRHDRDRDFDRRHPGNRYDHPAYRPGWRYPPPPAYGPGRHFKYPPYYYRGRYYAYPPPHHRGHFRPIYDRDGSIRMWIVLGF